MKTSHPLFALAMATLVASCSTGVRLPSVHEPLSSPKWARCAGELMTRQARALLDDLLLDSQAMLCRAAVSAHEGKVDESVELLNEAGVRDQEDYRPHYLAGRVLAQSGRFEEALTEFERATKRNPTLEVPSENLGKQVLERSGPLPAIDFLTKAKARGLCNYACQGLLGRTLQSQGRSEEAKAVYTEMITASPEEPAAYVGLASAENAAGRFASEAERLSQARSAAAFGKLPTDQQGEILYSLAFAQYNSHAYDKADATIAAALALDSDRALWHLLDGWIHLRQDDPHGAMTAFRAALALDKQLAAAHVGLGDAQMLGGDATAALESFEAASQLAPTDGVIVLKAAYATALLGHKEAARSLLEEAARLDHEHMPAELVEAISGLLEEAGASAGAAGSKSAL